MGLVAGRAGDFEFRVNRTLSATSAAQPFPHALPVMYHAEAMPFRRTYLWEAVMKIRNPKSEIRNS